jgi:peptidoglycan/LPS O-acetylase OafA/YrhL
MKQNRTNLFLGVLLILIGAWLVVTRQVPAVQDFLENSFTWPMWTIGAGLLIFLIGLITGAPGMAVPASIVAGIGGILYYQNQTDDYGSWAYMWALIPGFVGVGTILAGLLGENTRKNLAHGLNLIVISTLLFLVFATFLGGLSILGDYGAAVILILLGVYILIRGFVRNGSGYRGQDETR